MRSFIMVLESGAGKFFYSRCANRARLTALHADAIVLYELKAGRWIHIHRYGDQHRLTA